MALLFFLTGLFVFYYFTLQSGWLPDSAIGQQFSQLQELFKAIDNAPTAVTAALIFMNNFLSMAQMLLLGFLAGLSPLLTLFLNGALMGAVAGLLQQQGMPVFSFLLLGILPHGVFELTSFFICGGLGLKLGYHCLASPLPGKTRGESFRYIWKEAISVLPLVVFLLVAAAIVETYFTSALLQRFLP